MVMVGLAEGDGESPVYAIMIVWQENCCNTAVESL